MKLNKIVRFTSLLLALGLLLGLAVTGCTDKDRDNSQDVSIKTFTFNYSKALARRFIDVPAVATNVCVRAYDAEGKCVNSYLDEDDCTITPDSLGNCSAVTHVDADAVQVMYYFYNVDPVTQEEVFYDSRLVAVPTGDEVNDSVDNIVWFVILDSNNRLRYDFQYQVGETFSTQILAGKKDITFALDFQIVPTEESADLVIERPDSTRGLVYEAKAKGTVKFRAVFADGTEMLLNDMATVKIYDLSDLSEFYLLPTGYDVKDQKLFDPGDNEVQLSDLPETAGTIKLNEQKEMVMVGADENDSCYRIYVGGQVDTEKGNAKPVADAYCTIYGKSLGEDTVFGSVTVGGTPKVCKNDLTITVVE